MSLQLEQERVAASARQASRERAAVKRAEVNYERLRAPFSLRCGALLIDYIVLAGVMASATLLARLFGDMRRGSSVVLLAGYIAVAVVALLNFVLVAGLSGRTLGDRKSTRLNSSHVSISYAVFCLKKKTWPE